LKNSGRVVAHFSVSHTVSITERRISKKRKGWEIHMLPLLFILIVTGLSILVSCLVSDEITWFTYYIGAMANSPKGNLREKISSPEQSQSSEIRGRLRNGLPFYE